MHEIPQASLPELLLLFHAHFSFVKYGVHVVVVHSGFNHRFCVARILVQALLEVSFLSSNIFPRSAFSFQDLNKTLRKERQQCIFKLAGV